MANITLKMGLIEEFGGGGLQLETPFVFCICHRTSYCQKEQPPVSRLNGGLAHPHSSSCCKVLIAWMALTRYVSGFWSVFFLTYQTPHSHSPLAFIPSFLSVFTKLSERLVKRSITQSKELLDLD